MRKILAGIGAAALSGGLLYAQSADTRTKSQTKIEVKEGRDVTVTGCVSKDAGPSGYILENVTNRDEQLGNYILVGETDDLGEHVGHLVEVKGKLADKGKGEIEVQTKTEVERENAEDSKTEAKTEVKGDLKNLPFLGVKSVKMVRPSCE
jgi:hypothetical protein